MPPSHPRGRLYNSGVGAFEARPIVVSSILLDGMAAHIAIQLDPDPDRGLGFRVQKLGVTSGSVYNFQPADFRVMHLSHQSHVLTADAAL